MGIKEDIDVVSLNRTAAVLCGIDHAVNHDLTSVRNDSRVNRDSMIGGGDGSRTGMASPALRTDGTWAVAGSFKDTEGTERPGGSARAHGLYIADTVHFRVGKLHAGRMFPTLSHTDWQPSPENTCL